jgi:uncharacterized protein (TIGR03083 family)
VPGKRWTVKDVALHLLGGDVGIISYRRDGYLAHRSSASGQSLIEYLKTFNDTWVEATQRISPRLLCELLRYTGSAVSECLAALDPFALGDRVSWAGPDPAPNWLDIAREYTERWHHQQHIRTAVERPGFLEPRYLRPALDAFVRALPYTYRDVAAPDGASVELTVSGEAGDSWLLAREGGAWKLYLGRHETASAAVAIPQEIAWKLWTKWYPPNEAMARSRITGDAALAAKVFDMVSVIA